MDYIKKFETYLSEETCFLIDEFEYEKLTDIDFKKKETECSVSIGVLQNTFQMVCDSLFGKEKREYSEVYHDSIVGLQYKEIFGGDKLRCEIEEVKDYWFVGYFFYYKTGNLYTDNHIDIFFKCDQLDGIKYLSKKKQEIFDVIKEST